MLKSVPNLQRQFTYCVRHTAERVAVHPSRILNGALVVNRTRVLFVVFVARVSNMRFLLLHRMQLCRTERGVPERESMVRELQLLLRPRTRSWWCARLHWNSLSLAQF